MKDYKRIWKVRKIQIIIINLICAALGFYVTYSGYSASEGLLVWLVGSWVIAALISLFTKSGGAIAGFTSAILGIWFSGLAVSVSGEHTSAFWQIVFAWNLLKAIIGFMIMSAIFFIALIVYPVTTVYYFIKSRTCASVQNI